MPPACKAFWDCRPCRWSDLIRKIKSPDFVCPAVFCHLAWLSRLQFGFPICEWLRDGLDLGVIRPATGARGEMGMGRLLFRFRQEAAGQETNVLAMAAAQMEPVFHSGLSPFAVGRFIFILRN